MLRPLAYLDEVGEDDGHVLLVAVQVPVMGKRGRREEWKRAVVSRRP